MSISHQWKLQQNKVANGNGFHFYIKKHEINLYGIAQPQLHIHEKFHAWYHAAFRMWSAKFAVEANIYTKCDV